LWQKTTLLPWPSPFRRHPHCRHAERLAAIGTANGGGDSGNKDNDNNHVGSGSSRVVKTIAVTAMVRGTDNNKLKAAVEEMLAAAVTAIVTETATATETATKTAMATMPMPTPTPTTAH
jgi:hypothetical protein